MSAVTCLLSEDHFLCPICLDVFTAPVTIPCGHTFCKNCITQNWRINRKCKCPVCKKLFDIITELHVNIFISEMAAQFRQSTAKQTSEVSKPGEVPCDVCTGIKLKALKSCLVCLASYCEAHLERHHTVSGLKRHKLIDPLDNLEGRMCPKHNEVMELFCRTDQVCVCQLCNKSEHEGHRVVPLREEWEGRKTELGKAEGKLEQMILERQLKIQQLKQTAKLSKDAADKETADGARVFSALRQVVETSLAEVTEHIKQKQKAAEEQAEDFIKELDHEISKLRKRKSEVKQLVHSDDHLHLLQSFSSLSTFPPTKDWSKASLRQPSYEGVAARAVAQLKDTLSKGMEKLLEAELKRVQRYAVDLTLDPDTAHPKLILSDDGKQVNHSDVEKNLPDNPERFSYCVIVLSKQSFSCGRFYYEVEVKGKTKWDLGVASVSANRKGQITSSPEAGYWTLQLRNGKEYVALTDPDVVLSVKQRPQKVGVFVDYEEGLVCFFDVDTADLIYSFTGCSFTDKLHPFFSPCFNDNGDNSAPLRISAVNQTDCISHL
ncbi:E3 ubiquitin-protein ligase TRIM21-like [Anabas testudineus]|uniref:E3 ubiquitin-protein ligase TRIM21-like n=1 Tax=Anabas testudineus TaxID=64144 RepID=UPI000E45645A|nr:E3 ubiquitin-protein ligase TRIM21-like [Anabas testudineus]